MLHFNKDDLEYAEQMAKLSLYKKKEEDKGSSCSEYQSKKNVNSKAVSSSKLDSKLKFREGKMRIRQIVKLGKDLRESIEYLEKQSKKKNETTFRSPLELEKKQKQWEEFSLSARRTLYSLKREIKIVSLKISAPLAKLPDNTLRLLSSVCRTGHHLLKGLEKFSEETGVGHKGHSLLCDSLLVAQQILLVMAVGGVSFSAKSHHSEVSVFDAHLQSEEDSEILASDLDSEALSLIKPKAVRQKLSLLARSYMNKKPKQSKGKNYKIFAPLRQTKEALSEAGSPKDSESTPLTVELDEGRTIQFIQDSLSPKLRRRGHHRVYEDVPVTYMKRVGKDEGILSPPQMKPKQDHDISEKMADAVFEKILPYVTSSREGENPATQAEFLTNYADFDIYSEAYRRLQLIQEKFAEIEAVSENQDRFLSRVNEKLCNGQDASFHDLTQMIKAANVALEKTVELHLPHPASTFFTVPDASHSAPGGEAGSLGMQAKIQERDLGLHSSDLPKVQDELKKQKLEFWQSLADNYYVTPPSIIKEQLQNHQNLHCEPDCSTSPNPLTVPEFASGHSGSKQIAVNPLREDKYIQVDAPKSYGSSFEEEEEETSRSDAQSYDNTSSHLKKQSEESDYSNNSTSQSRSN